MSLTKNIQKSLFWVNVFKIAIPFFIVVSLFSIVFKTGSALFSGDFETINQVHFASNRWMRFLLQKGVISILYSVYVANKNMK